MADKADRPEGHDVCVGTEPCPKCGSSDNLKRYADGHAYCFSAGCEHHEPANDSSATRRPAPPPSQGKAPTDLLKADRPDAWDGLVKRKIDGDTLRRFGYFRGTFKDRTVHVAPYHDAAGNVVCQKLRFPNKDEGFPQLGGTASVKCQLFGQRIWGASYDRRVVVTEGEIDAMSVAQATGFKFPVVSVGGGAASARAHIMRNIDWLLRFEQVILWFDDDEPGRKAMQECVECFDPEKVRMVSTGDVLTGAKDPSDLMQASRPGDILTAIYNAKAYILPAIRSGRDLVDREEFLSATEERLALPFKHLSSVLRGGLKEREVVGIISGSGRGKSTVLFETVAHWLTAGHRVGAMFFEDAPVDVMLGIMTAYDNRRYRLTTAGADRAKLYDDWVESPASDNLFVLDNEAAEWSFDAFINYITAMARACRCDIVLIDPISFLAARVASTDERQQLDKAMAEIAAMAKRLGIRVVYTHHVVKQAEDSIITMGSLKGANGFNQYSTSIFALQPRVVGGLTPVSCLKSRFQGELRDHVLAVLAYDEATGRLNETPAVLLPRGRVPVAADLPTIQQFYDMHEQDRGPGKLDDDDAEAFTGEEAF